MFGLDQQIGLRGRLTTIRDELNNNRQTMMLFTYADEDNIKKYMVVFSKLPDNKTDTRAFEISEADFAYLREQGIRDAFK
jgi:hypothetical protein